LEAGNQRHGPVDVSPDINMRAKMVM
jgi:hypothetical protein